MAVTPDELGDAWHETKVHQPLEVPLNGALFGRSCAGMDMTFDFGRLIAHASLCAGTVIGSTTVSNVDPSAGPCGLAERRMLEKIGDGRPRTPFLRVGDRARIEMFDADGASVFGAIDQAVERYEAE